jgi:hypothetical protein
MAAAAGMSATFTTGAQTNAAYKKVFDEYWETRRNSHNSDREIARRYRQMLRGMLNNDSRGLEYEGLSSKHPALRAAMGVR